MSRSKERVGLYKIKLLRNYKQNKDRSDVHCGCLDILISSLPYFIAVVSFGEMTLSSEVGLD